tara:strand:- start:4145 stop:4321 length:177 start_codon:yes stop_codon:yes gene_type:complete
MKIEIKPTYPSSPEDNSTYNTECWDIYLDGKLHFSTSIDRKYLEEHTIPEWLRHLEEE